MNPNFNTLDVMQERIRDAQRARAREALVRGARAAHPAPAGLIQRALAGAGAWLVAQGRRLEARYEERPESVRSTAEIRRVGNL